MKLKIGNKLDAEKIKLMIPSITRNKLSKSALDHVFITILTFATKTTKTFLKN